MGLADWTSDARMCWQNKVRHWFLYILSEELSCYSITVMYIVNIVLIYPVWTVQQHVHVAWDEKNDGHLSAVIRADTEIVSGKRLFWTTSSSASCKRMKSGMRHLSCIAEGKHAQHQKVNMLSSGCGPRYWVFRDVGEKRAGCRPKPVCGPS